MLLVYTLLFSGAIFAQEAMVEDTQFLNTSINSDNNINLTNYNENIFCLFSEFKGGLGKCIGWAVGKVKERMTDVVDHPVEFAVGCVVGCAFLGYVHILSTIGLVNLRIKKGNLWSSWGGDCSVEDLMAIPREEFTRDLLQAIQFAYTSKKDPLNTDIPFRVFMKELKREKNFLKYYRTLHSLVSRIKMQRIFFSRVETEDQIKERIKKLEYFEMLFFGWLSEYKLKKLENEIAV